MNKLTITVIIAFLLAASLLMAGEPGDSDINLEQGFRNPPGSARRHTWYHWMNGHIRKEGMIKDLDAMKKMAH